MLPSTMQNVALKSDTPKQARQPIAYASARSTTHGTKPCHTLPQLRNERPPRVFFWQTAKLKSLSRHSALLQTCGICGFCRKLEQAKSQYAFFCKHFRMLASTGGYSRRSAGFCNNSLCILLSFQALAPTTADSNGSELSSPCVTAKCFNVGTASGRPVAPTAQTLVPNP